MTREELREAAAVMLAAADGRAIQRRYTTSNGNVGWEDITDPHFDWQCQVYRVKPEPKLRPWTAETCPFPLAVRLKSCEDKHAFTVVSYADSYGVRFLCSREKGIVSWQKLADNWTRRDGSPCGGQE